MKLNDKVFVVTGGGSGIGQQLVLELLRRGARVAAVDLRQEGLDETVRLAASGDRLSVHQANITDKERVFALPEEVSAHHGAIDGLINCAGIIQPFVDFKDLEYDVIERVLNVNLWGTIHMLKAFLPSLLVRPEAHIADVSSMGGFLSFPGQTLYSASKAAVKLLTEGLYSELMETSVGVSVVMPGAVATHITENSGVDGPAAPDSDKAANMTTPADVAAKVILDGIERKKLHILVGRDAKMLHIASRISTSWATRFIQRQMKSMRE